MARFLTKRDNAVGQPPGSLIFHGQQMTGKPRLRIIDYDTDSLRDDFLDSVETLSPCLSSESTSWLNVDGLHVPELMTAIGSTFNISPMILEDIVNTGHRPKIEESPEAVFITLKMLSLSEDQTEIMAEQLSAVLTGRSLLTFQEKPGDVFEPVRERIRRKSGKLRKLGPDYLLYTLLDCIFENYLKVVEIMGEKIEGFADEVLSNPTNELLEEINSYRREMAFIRKAVRPAREIILKMLKVENGLIADAITPFIKDLMDMAEQINDAVDIYREMLNDHLNSYNMAVANRLNDVMKFLTIFATIFIPLSFLAGVYGMNFKNMPELEYPYGYYLLLGVMATVAVSMLLYFKKRKWI